MKLVTVFMSLKYIGSECNLIFFRFCLDVLAYQLATLIAPSTYYIRVEIATCFPPAIDVRLHFVSLAAFHH